VPDDAKVQAEPTPFSSSVVASYMWVSPVVSPHGVADARSLGNTGAASTAAVVFTLRADLIAVFGWVRIFSPNIDYSLEASKITRTD
jgi:hypothetical protein